MRRRFTIVILVGAALTASAPSAAEQARTPETCRAALAQLGVAHTPVRRPGIEIGVRVEGDIGGVEYRPYRERPLILDCSLVVSLAEAARYFRALGIERVTYSAAYQRRNVRGTDRVSRHSYGLAIDLHVLEGGALGALRVAEDYEQGLGDAVDCVGTPLTEGGLVLKALDCQLDASGLFRMLLTPDSDSAHHNHFHLEARPWSERR